MGALKTRLGPLPAWGWLALVTILLLGWYLWSRRSGAAGAGAAGQLSGSVPEVVVQTGGQASPDQSAVPPPEPGFSAAQGEALQDQLQALRTEERADEREEPRSGRSRPRKARRGYRRPPPARRRPAAGAPPGRPAGGFTGGAGGPERPLARTATPARHLATSHPVAD
jgi:hypothetical protein